MRNSADVPDSANPATTLNCWSEVAAFRGAVARLEQVVLNNPSDGWRNADLTLSPSNMLTHYGSGWKSKMIDVAPATIILSHHLEIIKHVHWTLPASSSFHTCSVPKESHYLS